MLGLEPRRAACSPVASGTDDALWLSRCWKDHEEFSSKHQLGGSKVIAVANRGSERVAGLPRCLCILGCLLSVATRDTASRATATTTTRSSMSSEYVATRSSAIKAVAASTASMRRDARIRQMSPHNMTCSIVVDGEAALVNATTFRNEAGPMSLSPAD